MAIIESFDKETRRQLGKTVVVKHYKDGLTIMTKFPDMSGIKPSPSQKSQRLSFKEAQTSALQKLLDPKVKASYQDLCKPGQRPHNVLISELLRTAPPVAETTGKQLIIVSGKV